MTGVTSDDAPAREILTYELFGTGGSTSRGPRCRRWSTGVADTRTEP